MTDEHGTGSSVADPLGTVAASTHSLRKKKFGELLVDFKILSPKQLTSILAMQTEAGKPLGELLVEQGYINSEERDQLLAVQKMLEENASLMTLPLDKNLLKILPDAFARKHLVIPLARTGNRLFIACYQPTVTLIDEMELNTGLTIHPLSFREQDLQAAVEHFFGSKKAAMESIDRAVKSTAIQQAQSRIRKVEAIDERATGEAPVIQLVNSILMDGIKRDASDIHLDPHEAHLIVRYRIDGVLHKIMEIPKSLEPSVITRVKVLSDMNITEKRRSQDGRFSVDMGVGRFDFRVSVIASMWGEKISLRILRPMSILRGVEQLGMGKDDLERFQIMLDSPFGIIMTTGPTSSGKTTTLYAAIERLDKERDNIMTIEDPIEYPVVGITQTQVQPKIGMTFAESLRTLLRHDPDVIMVGEIRDYETLETANNAALTGHLVLSTIHTNDAISTITRLLDMGLPAYLAAATVTGVIAQRLARRLCTSCSEEYQATEEEKHILRVDEKEPLTLTRGYGCDICSNTGYKGQVGLFELLLTNTRLQELIAANEPLHIIRRAARESGMRTLWEDGRNKILKGLTTVDEITRVLGHRAEDP